MTYERYRPMTTAQKNTIELERLEISVSECQKHDAITLAAIFQDYKWRGGMYGKTWVHERLRKLEILSPCPENLQKNNKTNMTHAQMLAALTRELVRMEVRMEKQNPEMVLGMAMARRVMERMYESAAIKGEI